MQGQRGSLKCSGWDIHGPTSSFALWWDKHFGFFNLQKDKVKYYNAWKSLELKLHQEFYSQPTHYDGAYYACKYDIMKNVFDVKSEFASMFSSGSQPYSSATSNPSSISFRRAVARSLPLPAASSVENRATCLWLMPTTSLCQNFAMGELPMPSIPMAPCTIQMVRRSASDGTHAMTPSGNMERNDCTFVSSVAPPTMPSPGNATQSMLTSEGFLNFFHILKRC